MLFYLYTVYTHICSTNGLVYSFQYCTFDLIFLFFFVYKGALVLGNDVHTFILHYIYLPRINRVIKSFVSGWNKHPLRSERNWSPERLWANGMFDLRNQNLTQVSELHVRENVDVEDLEWYGMDWFAPNPTDNGLSVVELEDIEIPFSEEYYERLTQYDPLAESSSFGMDIYLSALSIFSQD